MSKYPSNNKKKKIVLALQGGGAHGAFTWGVLDAFLEDGRFDIEGLSGTSSGGMNAVALAYGMMLNGHDGARDCLYRFWKRMSDRAKMLGMISSPLDKINGRYGVNFCVWFQIFNNISKNLSPYEWNPNNINFLEQDLRELFDIKKLSEYEKIKVFLCATNVRTGKLKIFSGKELSFDAILASSCLPEVSHAVTIAGQDYWDGGFIGNPAIFPLIENCESSDIVVILLTPTLHSTTPKTARSISHRLTQISATNCLIREVRAISFITKLIEKNIADPKKIKRLNIHIIQNNKMFNELDPTSASNIDWDFLQHLFEEGRHTGRAWLKENFEFIGVKSSVDIDKDFF